MDPDVPQTEELKTEKPCGCKNKQPVARAGPRRKKNTRCGGTGCLGCDYGSKCSADVDRLTRRVAGG